MNPAELFQRVWRRFSRPPAPPPQPGQQANLHPRLQRMLTQLAQTQDQELSCDEVFALLDIFAQRMRHGEDPAILMPLVRHHLEMCPDCHEELDVLLRSLDATAPQD